MTTQNTTNSINAAGASSSESVANKEKVSPETTPSEFIFDSRKVDWRQAARVLRAYLDNRRLPRSEMVTELTMDYLRAHRYPDLGALKFEFLKANLLKPDRIDRMLSRLVEEIVDQRERHERRGSSKSPSPTSSSTKSSSSSHSSSSLSSSSSRSSSSLSPKSPSRSRSTETSSRTTNSSRQERSSTHHSTSATKISHSHHRSSLPPQRHAHDSDRELKRKAEEHIYHHKSKVYRVK